LMLKNTRQKKKKVVKEKCFFSFHWYFKTDVMKRIINVFKKNTLILILSRISPRNLSYG
jgi:hypothetical protein